MGPDLMDDVWIYGSRLEQIHQTLVDGRPNGMPAWGGKVPDEQLWDLAAYVRSLSLPQTIAAQTGQYAVANAGTRPARSRSGRGLVAAARYDQRLHVDHRRSFGSAERYGDRRSDEPRSDAGDGRALTAAGTQLAVAAATLVAALVAASLDTSAVAAAESAGRPAARARLVACSDPNDLPFSNRVRQGFENKIIELVGRDLGAEVSYLW